MSYARLGYKAVRAFGNDTVGAAAADISMAWSEAGCFGDSVMMQ